MSDISELHNIREQLVAAENAYDAEAIVKMWRMIVSLDQREDEE